MHVLGLGNGRSHSNGTVLVIKGTLKTTRAWENKSVLKDGLILFQVSYKGKRAAIFSEVSTWIKIAPLVLKQSKG